MTSKTLSREQVRNVDQRAIAEYGMTGLQLMENAGRGCVDVMERIGLSGLVAIACGKGNNGGDGFVIARHLQLRGYAVRVLVCCDPAQLEGDAAVNYRILSVAEFPMSVLGPQCTPQLMESFLAGANWVVDALLGTGSRGEPRPPLDGVIDALNGYAATKLAVDLPSGLDCDSGQAARHTFRADHTCTFVAMKTGFTSCAAASWLGRVHIIDIGIPRKLRDDVLK